MKINFSLKKHISHNGFLYVIALIATCLGFCYGVKLKTAPKRYEMFNTFVGATMKDSASYREYISTNTQGEFKEINTYAYDPYSFNTYVSSYRSFGLNETDILILPETYVYEDDFYAFHVLPDEFRSDTDWTSLEVSYGILVFDGENGVFSDYINYVSGTKYYLFVAHSSKHTLGFRDDVGGKTNYVSNLLRAIKDEEKKA